MPWGSSWELGDNKKKCKTTAQWSAGLPGNSVWNKHPAEFQVSMIQRIFVYGNSEISAENKIRVMMWGNFELQISPCPDIGQHYVLLQPKR